MTGTVQDTFGRSRDHSTRQMRALLAVRHELTFAHPNEHTRIVFARVVEDHGTADGQRSQAGDPASLGQTEAPAKPVLAGDPELADGQREAREHQELHEVAALDVLILRPVDRKILAPRRLQLGRPEIRRNRDLFPLERGPVEVRGCCPGQPFTGRGIDAGIDGRFRMNVPGGHG